ncbi:MAG: PhzF family phenazine biosynthesis protein [Bacteroidetes bacterium]|nr:PhzF family phenazine biosynthesis protein [Bacteroidota bacterium]
MNLKVYFVNAFAETSFGGNPAAVIYLDQWLDDDLMQRIAAQHNLAETAFIVAKANDFHIRWFTPAVEVALCGHATLASAHVFYRHLGYRKEKISFFSKSGWLHVSKGDDDKLALDFPTDQAIEVESIPIVSAGLGVQPLELYKGISDYMAVLENQQVIEALKPDFRKLAQLKSRGIIVTAKGFESDFVSRCFFPQSGIDEDPVTGSAHTVLTPFWAQKLGKKKLSAIQLSKRKGFLDCELKGERVLISGKAMTYLEGEIFL